MTREAFVQDWKERYIKGTCTIEHLERLQKIGRLTTGEIEAIKMSKEVLA